MSKIIDKGALEYKKGYLTLNGEVVNQSGLVLMVNSFDAIKDTAKAVKMTADKIKEFNKLEKELAEKELSEADKLFDKSKLNNGKKKHSDKLDKRTKEHEEYLAYENFKKFQDAYSQLVEWTLDEHMLIDDSCLTTNKFSTNPLKLKGKDIVKTLEQLAVDRISVDMNRSKDTVTI